MTVAAFVLVPPFRARRSFAERHASAWYVPSAKHGLLDPATVIEPYGVTLNTMRMRGEVVKEVADAFEVLDALMQRRR